MLTISQLAAYAGVTVRAVRHYHAKGLLPEPERDQSGYRRYDAAAVVELVKIRTLAEAGVPLSRVHELLAAGDRLLVQLRLEARGLLGVLLEDPLGLRPGLAQLALGVRAQLVGLHLGLAEHLLGLVAEVAAAVVGGPGHEGAARLVQLGAQHLDLVAEVLGVLDRLFPLGLQPLHLGLEPREVVDVSRRLSLLAFVAPHCAVPSVPWSQPLTNELRPTAERGPRGMVSDQRRSTGCRPHPRPPKPGPRP